METSRQSCQQCERWREHFSERGDLSFASSFRLFCLFIYLFFQSNAYSRGCPFLGELEQVWASTWRLRGLSCKWAAKPQGQICSLCAGAWSRERACSACACSELSLCEHRVTLVSFQRSRWKSRVARSAFLSWPGCWPSGLNRLTEVFISAIWSSTLH